MIEAKIDVNILDDLTGDALLHTIMKKKRKQERLNFLLTLLTRAKVDVNLRNRKGTAALHMAVEVINIMKRWPLITLLIFEIERWQS